MTAFEIIILVLMYIFCYTFSITMVIVAECDKVERVILFLAMLVCSPIFTIATLGVYIAAVLHNYHHE